MTLSTRFHKSKKKGTTVLCRNTFSSWKRSTLSRSSMWMHTPRGSWSQRRTVQPVFVASQCSTTEDWCLCVRVKFTRVACQSAGPWLLAFPSCTAPSARETTTMRSSNRRLRLKWWKVRRKTLNKALPEWKMRSCWRRPATGKKRTSTRMKTLTLLTNRKSRNPSEDESNPLVLLKTIRLEKCFTFNQTQKLFTSFIFTFNSNTSTYSLIYS